MGLFKNLRSLFHADWCSQCKTPMEEMKRRLFALPTMTVGHYTSHKDAEYYRRNLRSVERKEDIPTAMYACRAVAYRCPECGHRAVRLSVFLPVRDQEKPEEAFLFENGEVDSLFTIQYPQMVCEAHQPALGG